MDLIFPRERLLELAGGYGTPLYVYAGDLVRRRYAELVHCFPYAHVRVLYAMKANFNPDILSILKEAGAGIDAVSEGDCRLAKRVGFDRIMYTANNMTDAEMRNVHKMGVLFNIGSLSELRRFGSAFPRNDVCLRFNAGIEAGHHKHVMTGGESSKFGIPLREVDDALRIAKAHELRIVGVHEHSGSGIPESVDMQKGMDALLTIVTPSRFPDLEFVDIGGGFKVPYRPDEQKKDYRTFGEYASRKMADLSATFGRDLFLLIEPGRFLVAESGVLLMQAMTVKKNLIKTIVGTNAGFPQLIRPLLYGAYHHLSNLSNPDGKLQKYDVVGNICETGDYFCLDRELPHVREGDILAVHTAGAYCYSMGGFYNLRPMPAEVVIEGEHVKVRKARTAKALADSFFAKV